MIIKLLTGVALAVFFFAVSPTLVSASASVSVQSISPSTSITVGTPITFSVVATDFTNPAFTIADSFTGSSVSSGNLSSSGNFSWTPVATDIGTHMIGVTVIDAQGNNVTVQTQITVSPKASVSIESLWPGPTVSPNSAVSFKAVPFGFISPTYSVSDSNQSTLTASNIDTMGNFIWTPKPQDVGTHVITVKATDSVGHSATFNQNITVTSIPTATIQALSPGSSVAIGSLVTFSTVVSGFTNPTYTISDSIASTITNARINSFGKFSWKPTTGDVGEHNIVVSVNDEEGHSANVLLKLIVQSANISVTAVSPNTYVNPGVPLTLTVTPVGFVNAYYTLKDNFYGTTLSNSKINGEGKFAWTPTAKDIGVHTITFFAVDPYGQSSDTSITITVGTDISVSLTPPIPGTTVPVGTALIFTAAATGFTSPKFTVTDSFSNTTLTSGNVNATGLFSWVPKAQDAGAHIITVTATDSLGHSASSQVTINVPAVSGVPTSAPAPVSAVAPVSADSSASATKYVFSTSLSQGMTSSEVSALQKVLKEQGFFSGTITNYFGPATVKAVKDFQAAKGLEKVGSVGPTTKAALNALSGGIPAPTKPTVSNSGYKFKTYLVLGSKGDEVTELQKRLTTEGVYSASLSGYYGEVTKAAVKAYQAKKGIAQTGTVGPSTRALLNQ